MRDRRRIGSLARAAAEAAGGRDVLYQGTRSLGRIIADDVILKSHSGQIAVSFTRSPEVAAYWALLPRSEPDEEGGVLVVSRAALTERYLLEHFHDGIWDTDDSFVDEQEERVVGLDVVGLSSILVGTVGAGDAIKERGVPSDASCLALPDLRSAR